MSRQAFRQTPQWRFDRVVLLLLFVFAFPVASLPAQDVKEDEPDKVLAQERLDLMQKRIAQFVVRPAPRGPEFPGQFEAQPIFRYDDPARGYVAAALWKLGAEGRPLAIISTELQPLYHGRPRIVYEYLSLTAQSLIAASPDYYWSPEGSAIEFKPVPDSPAPAENERLRLLQMRKEARRFSGFELVAKERCELRLLPQPVDRYTPNTAERADGGVFILAFGTNPEAVLFLESDGTKWNYAFGRLSGAQQIQLKLDNDAVVWEVGPVKYASSAPYTASNAAASIPGIAPDGSPIPTE